MRFVLHCKANNSEWQHNRRKPVFHIEKIDMAKYTHLLHHDASSAYMAVDAKEAERLLEFGECDDVTEQYLHTLRAALQGEWVGGVLLPKDMCVKGTEHGEQAALFAWAAALANVGIAPELKAMFAVPNGGERGAESASQIKAEGGKAGVPDVFLAHMTRHGDHLYGGLFIEMKRANGTPSDIGPKQHEWIDRLRGNGYGAMVCYGWKHAAEMIIQYLQINVDNPKVPEVK